MNGNGSRSKVLSGYSSCFCIPGVETLKPFAHEGMWYFAEKYGLHKSIDKQLISINIIYNIKKAILKVKELCIPIYENHKDNFNHSLSICLTLTPNLMQSHC